MVFPIDPKRFHRMMFAFRQQFLIEMKNEQSMNESSINDNPRPLDPVIEQLAQDTTVDELQNSKPLIGEGFGVKGGKIPRNNNNKLRKFVSLKL